MPIVPPSSSSAVARQTTSRSGCGCSRASARNASSSQTAMPFMSSVPRPHNVLIVFSAANGGCDQPRASAGTTSMWLRSMSPSPGRRPRMRAYTLPRPGAAALELLREEARAGGLMAGRIAGVDADVAPQQLDLGRDLHRLRDVELALEAPLLDDVVNVERADGDRARHGDGDRDPPAPHCGSASCGGGAGSRCVPSASATTCTGSSYAVRGWRTCGCQKIATRTNRRLQMPVTPRPICTKLLR